MVLRLMGYERVIPHPLLTRRAADGTSEDFCPDFMGLRPSGLWEIVEIKRPDTAVLKAPTRRQQFYAEFGRYVSQCREYSKYFEDSNNRAFFEQTYSTSVQSQVKAYLLAGRNDGMDRFRVNELIAESRALEFETYDELFERLANIWRTMEGEREGLPGFAFVARAIVLPGEETDRLWLVDIGRHEDRNRISVYMQGTSLHVDVYDDDGHLHEMRVQAGNALSRTLYLGFELGFCERFAFGRIWLDDSSEMTRWPPFRFTFRPVESHVVGSDMTGAGRSEFYLGELLFLAGPPSLTERIRLRAYMMARVTAPATWLHFTNGAFMFNGGHPRFSSRVVQYAGVRLLVPEPEERRDLTQPTIGRQPILVVNPLDQPDFDSPEGQ